MDWNDLKYFLAVERNGSIRSAALSLTVSHSTVSRRLRELERRLEARLFDRTPEGFVLTTAGEAVLGLATQIETEVIELERKISGSDVGLTGTIRVTLPPALAESLLLPDIHQFMTLHPGIDIELVATEAFSDLSRRDADLAIRFTDAPDQHLIGRRLPPFRDGVYASARYVRENTFGGTDGTARWISWADRTLFARRIADTPYGNAGVAWTLPTIPLQALGAREHIGMALLPCAIGDQDPALVRVPGSGVYDRGPSWLLMHPDLRKMERVRIFAQFLTDAIAAKKDLIGGLKPQPGVPQTTSFGVTQSPRTDI